MKKYTWLTLLGILSFVMVAPAKNLVRENSLLSLRYPENSIFIYNNTSQPFTIEVGGYVYSVPANSPQYNIGTFILTVGSSNTVSITNVGSSNISFAYEDNLGNSGLVPSGSTSYTIGSPTFYKITVGEYAE
ncbi:MAG: hypothetical protein QM610_06250 [Chitinophagaceae bacterium]